MNISLSEYIKHPDRLDNDSLPYLRKLVAEYPYFQTARLLYLRNLYQLHDAAFDKELRKASFYLSDRKALFMLTEGENYRLEPYKKHQPKRVKEDDDDRTGSLIDTFLSSIPEEKPKRMNKVDASVDYMGYLLQTEDAPDRIDSVPTLEYQDLIDSYINQGDKRIVLSDQPEGQLQTPDLTEEDIESNEDYFTETLAKIYIKQGRYTKALEIIRRLSLKYPKKNRYFADQIRFLEKLIINNKNKNS